MSLSSFEKQLRKISSNLEFEIQAKKNREYRLLYKELEKTKKMIPPRVKSKFTKEFNPKKPTIKQLKKTIKQAKSVAKNPQGALLRKMRKEFRLDVVNNVYGNDEQVQAKLLDISKQLTVDELDKFYHSIYSNRNNFFESINAKDNLGIYDFWSSFLRRELK